MYSFIGQWFALNKSRQKHVEITMLYVYDIFTVIHILYAELCPTNGLALTKFVEYNYEHITST